MIERSGKVIILKSTAYDINSDSTLIPNITGRKAVTNIMIMTIILNAMIKYLDFNLNSPKTAYCRNDKIKILLRQRYKAAGFKKAWGIK